MTADVQPLDRLPPGGEIVDLPAGDPTPMPPVRGSGWMTAETPGTEAVSAGLSGWRGSAVASLALIVARPSVVAAGLLGFLARGGLVAFLLPIVVLPTPTGISNFIGGNALTGAGASESLIELIAAAVVVVVVLLVLGIVIGAMADLLLIREAVALAAGRERGLVTDAGRASADREARRLVPVDRGAIWQVIGVRVVALVPVSIGAAWATSRLVAAGYHQLIAPDDTTVPLGLRILHEAFGATVVLVAIWLVSEWIGGLAVREAVLGRRSIGRAYAGALAGIVRRPFTSLLTLILGVGALGALALLTLFASSLLWSRLQAMLADGVPVVIVLLATMMFVLAWGGGLLLVGAAAAGRSVLGTLDVLRIPSVSKRWPGSAAVGEISGDGSGAPHRGLAVRAAGSASEEA